jgi:hypothetical protein
MARNATQRIAIATLLALAAGALAAASEPAPQLREAARTALSSLQTETHRVATLLDGSTSAMAYAAPLARSTLSISQ